MPCSRSFSASVVMSAQPRARSRRVADRLGHVGDGIPGADLLRRPQDREQPLVIELRPPPPDERARVPFRLACLGQEIDADIPKHLARIRWRDSARLVRAGTLAVPCTGMVGAV